MCKEEILPFFLLYFFITVLLTFRCSVGTVCKLPWKRRWSVGWLLDLKMVKMEQIAAHQPLISPVGCARWMGKVFPLTLVHLESCSATRFRAGQHILCGCMFFFQAATQISLQLSIQKKKKKKRLSARFCSCTLKAKLMGYGKKSKLISV